MWLENPMLIFLRKRMVEKTNMPPITVWSSFLFLIIARIINPYLASRTSAFSKINFLETCFHEHIILIQTLYFVDKLVFSRTHFLGPHFLQLEMN